MGKKITERKQDQIKICNAPLRLSKEASYSFLKVVLYTNRNFQAKEILERKQRQNYKRLSKITLQVNKPNCCNNTEIDIKCQYKGNPTDDFFNQSKTQIRLFNQCWPYKSLNHLAKLKNSNQVKAPKSYDVQDYMFRWWSLLCWQSLDLRSIKTGTTEQKTCVLTPVKPA